MVPQLAECLQQPPSEPNKRNLYSCDECRRNKKGGCQILSTGHEGEASPSCARCLKKGLICSGPVYIQRKPRTVANTDAAANVQSREENEVSRKRTRDTTEENRVMSQPNTARHPPGSRPMQAWGLAGTASSDDDAPDPKQVLVQLGNLNAARELLRSCIYVCEDVRSWRSGCIIVDGAQKYLKSVKASVEASFKALAGQAEADVEMNARYASDLHTIITRFRRPSSRPATSDLGNDAPLQDFDFVLDRLDNKLVDQQRRNGVYSVADHLCYEVCIMMSSGKMPRFGLHRRSFLMSAFQAIDKIMKDLRVPRYHNVTLYPSNTLREENNASHTICFPLSHLTLLQADDDVLRSYVQRKPECLSEVDLLDRTIFHLAAYFGRTSFIESTLEHHSDKRILSTIKQDAFKLYPHMIAACRNDVKAVKLFVKHGADLSVFDANNLTCLDLAVRTGAIDVVNWLLQNGYGNRSYGNPLLQALKLNRLDMVDVFITYYSASDHHNYGDVIDAANFAQRSGRYTIAERLRTLESNRPSQQAQVWESFTNLDYDNGYNIPVFDSPVDQVTPYILPNWQVNPENTFSPVYNPFRLHMHGPNGPPQLPDQG